MALSFQATMAEEESHTRSRSMETSLRMRLDNGLPLTPKLLGYTHDIDGNLIINPEEAPTVKLITDQEKLTKLFQKWWRKKSLEVLNQRVDYWYPIIEK